MLAFNITFNSKVCEFKIKYELSQSKRFIFLQIGFIKKNSIKIEATSLSFEVCYRLDANKIHWGGS